MKKFFGGKALGTMAIMVFVAGYIIVKDSQEQQSIRDQQKNALITAKLYLAKSVSADNQELYYDYRDSLLGVYGRTKEEIQLFMVDFEDSPELNLPFTELVKTYVDSLAETDEFLWDRAVADTLDSE